MATRTPAKKATPPAKKAVGAAKTTVTATKKAAQDDEPDLLAGLGEEDTVDDNEEIDLLDGISEDNGDAWMPADDEDIPTGIQGTVINVTILPGDPAYTPRGEIPPDIPMLDIEEKDGHIWSVRAYHSVLRNQIEKYDPQVGDLIAIKYLGKQANKKGDNEYYNYGMNCPACMKRKRG